MTDVKALYRAVLEAPADDAPRLVYADWLDDNGDPDKAKIIRVQCEIAREEQLPIVNEARIKALNDQIHGLPSPVRSWEVFQSPKLPRNAGTILGLKRGFLHCRAECTSIKQVALLREHFIPITELVVKNIPVKELIEHLRLADSGDKAGKVLKNIMDLTIKNRFDDKDCHLLAESAAEWPHLQSLSLRTLRRSSMTHEGMEALAHASFPQLRNFAVRPSLHMRSFEAALRPLREQQIADPALPINHPHLRNYTPTPHEVMIAREEAASGMDGGDNEVTPNPRRRIGPQRADGSRARGGGEKTP